MKKIIAFLADRKKLFETILRYIAINFILFSTFGIYFRSQTYISSISVKNELYTAVLFLGIAGGLALCIGVLCAVAAMINKVTMRISGIFLTVLCTTFLAVDAIVFSQYKFHIERTMLALFLSEAGPELISFSWGMSIMALGGFFCIIAIVCAMMYIAEKFSNKTFTRISKACVIIIAVGCIIFHLWHMLVSFQAETTMLERNQIFPCNVGLTAKRFLMRLGFSPGYKNVMDVKTGSLAYPLKPLTFDDKSPKYNVVFLVVDSLRGDMMTPEVMPYTYNLALQSAFFKNHYSNGNCTRIGVFTMFSGLIGTYWFPALNAQRGSVLVDTLLERKYQTGVFFSAALTSPEFNNTIFSNVKNMTLKRKGKTKIARDDEAIDDFKSFIRKSDKTQPLFGVLMYDSLHGYEYPGDFQTKFSPAYTAMNYLILRKDDVSQQRKVYNLIRNATSFIDKRLENMIEFLKRELDWKNTIIVITSDHGNECNEAGNNIWGHNSKFSQYQLHVPLIITGGAIQQGTYEHRTFHIDIVPTLLNILGCKNTIDDYSSGQSLFDTGERDMIVVSGHSNRAMLYGDTIYEMTPAGITHNYTLDEKQIKNPPSVVHTRKYFDMQSRFIR